jgi:hypothetical protein
MWGPLASQPKAAPSLRVRSKGGPCSLPYGQGALRLLKRFCVGKKTLPYGEVLRRARFKKRGRGPFAPVGRPPVRE